MVSSRGRAGREANRTMRPLLMAAVTVLSACGDHAGQSSAAAGGALATPTAALAARPAIVPTIAYQVSSGTITSDVPVFLRRPGAAGDLRVGDGVMVRGI